MIDDRLVAHLDYTQPFRPVGRPGQLEPMNWDVWLPHNDYDALRAALRTTPAAVEKRAKALFIFADHSRHEMYAKVEFKDPKPMFTTVEHTALLVEAMLPPGAFAGRPTNFLAVAGLLLDDRPAALTPFMPPLIVHQGDRVVNTIET